MSAPHRPLGNTEAPSRLASGDVWRRLDKASFAVVSHVTAGGEPRSSGVVFATVDRRLVMVTAADSWKARQIEDGDLVAVTVPIRRGGLLALVAPIPPATISFRATALVHPAGSVDVTAMSKRLARLLPSGGGTDGCVIELTPLGSFLTYGIGVSLRAMIDPQAASARVPVS